MYRGWIILPEGEEGGKIIVECGLSLKEKQPDGSYDVEVNEEGLERLDRYWGLAYWGLSKDQELAKEK